MPVDRPWPHLGELDEDDGIRIPISHWFRPPGSSMGLNRYPAIWGWRATGRFLNDGDWFDSVQIQVTSRGKGVADP
ncbi:MAG: hypothetical protein O2800_07420 [Planctomycetota bacterium]|nr:hypothetical protein [Planctomycetota bacterium]